jgi:hypothetical protein
MPRQKTEEASQVRDDRRLQFLLGMSFGQIEKIYEVAVHRDSAR